MRFPISRLCAVLSIVVTGFVLVLGGCSREVTSPEGVSARFAGPEIELGGGKVRTVSVSAKLPPQTKFLKWDFRLEYLANGKKETANCCLRLVIDKTSVDAYEVETFTTVAKTVKAEFLFVVPATPKPQEVTLMYKNAPTGKSLTIAE